MSPRLRPAGVAHAAVCAALHAEAFSAPWDAAALALLLADAGAMGLIALPPIREKAEEKDEEDGAPLGFILCRQAADEAEVLTIAVRPAARRRGVGTALLAGGLAALAARGTATVFLEVAEDNPAARALYAAHGFVSAGRRRGYYRRPDGPPADALVLTRALPLTTPCG